MGRDPRYISWALAPDEQLGTLEFEDEIQQPVPQPEPPALHVPLHAPPESSRPLRRITFLNADEEEPNAASYAGPTLMSAGAGAPVPFEQLSAVSSGSRQRRRWFTGCAWFLVSILVLMPLIGFFVVLRSNAFQSGSGTADGVELHPTPVAPLVQRTIPLPGKTPQPTATLQSTTHSPNRPPDSQATPTPRPHVSAPTPTSAPSGKGQPTPTAVIVPTSVPTSGPTAVPQPSTTASAQPTATAIPPTPIATPVPATPTATSASASTGTLTFTDQSQQVSNSADMTGCPSGCTFGTQPVSGSTHVATTWNASGRTQTALSGTVQVVLTPLNGAVPSFDTYFVGTVTGNGWGCPINQTVIAYNQLTVNCSFGVSHPNSLPANTISGQEVVNSDRDFLNYNSSAFSGNSVPQVTQGDCQNALAFVENQGWAWVQNTWNGATNGNIVARSFTDGESNQSCPVGAIVPNDIFTVSVDAQISNGLVYSPSGPSNAAQAEVNAALPGGWNVPYRSAVCYPTTVGVSGNTVTASCQDSALATYPWSQSDLNGLAQVVAGQSLSQATSTCNGWAHVAGNCSATSDAGGSMPPPSAWQSISVNPQNPPNPFGGADIGGGLPATALLRNPVLPFLSLALLVFGCAGVLRRRQVSIGRKVVS